MDITPAFFTAVLACYAPWMAPVLIETYTHICVLLVYDTE